MKISVEILKRELEGPFGFKMTGEPSATLNLETMLFIDGSTWIDDGKIYIADKTWKKRPGMGKTASVLLQIGKPDASASDCFSAVFAFPAGSSVYSLHNKVQGIFAYYNGWSAELQRILSAGSDVQAMIDVSTDILKSSLILQDRKFSTVAVSEKYAKNPSLAPIIDNKSIPYMVRPNSFGVGGLDTGSTASLFQITGRQALYINLYQQGRFQYRLMALDMAEGFYPSTAPLLEYLSNFIRLAIGFVVDETKEKSTLSYVLKNILAGEYSDSRYIELRLREFGWRSAVAYVCARVCADIPEFNNRTLHYMCGRLKAVFEDAGVFEHENSIVMVFNLNYFDGRMEEVEAALIGFLQDNNLKAGFSNTFTDFSDLGLYFIQASSALDLGARQNPDMWAYSFRDVMGLFLIESCTERLPARLVCDPVLLKLVEYDRVHNTELYNTLYVYLKNNLRAVHAANELFIHRSTFLYRLERIKKITGLSLEDDDDYWYLLLSFRLLQQANNS